LAVRPGAVEAAVEVHLDAAAADPVAGELRAAEVKPEARVAHVHAGERASRARHREFRVRAVAEGEALVLAEGAGADEAVQGHRHARRGGEYRLGFSGRCGGDVLR